MEKSENLLLRLRSSDRFPRSVDRDFDVVAVGHMALVPAVLFCNVEALGLDAVASPLPTGLAALITATTPLASQKLACQPANILWMFMDRECGVHHVIPQYRTGCSIYICDHVDVVPVRSLSGACAPASIDAFSELFGDSACLMLDRAEATVRSAMVGSFHADANQTAL